MDQYYARSVVWASARGDIFWPGQVIESDKDTAIPAKTHVTIKFLIEDSYEDIRNQNKICTWNCEKQNTFILKGRALKNAERKIQFNKAVAKADNLFMLQAKKGVNMSLHEDVSITKSPPETGSNKKIRNSGPRSGLILRTSPRIKMAKQNFTSNAADKSAKEQAQPTKTITANFEIKLDSATCTREALKRTSPASRLQTESKVTDSNSWTPNVKRRKTSPRQSKNLTSVEKNGETSDCLQAQYNGHQKSKAKRQLLEDESPKKGASSKKPKPAHHIGKPMENNKSIEQSAQRMLKVHVNHENGIGKNELRMSSENSEHGSGVADKESEAAVGINSSASSDGSSDDELLSEPFSPSQEANQFLVGDIVWAKYSREPYWPALIKKITGKRKKDLKFAVRFLGWHDCLFRIQPKKLAHYASQRAEFMSIKDKLKNKDLEAFEEAVIQAEDLLTRKGLGKSLEEEELDEDLEIVEEPEEAAEQEDLPQQPSLLFECRKSLRAKKQVSKYSNILSYIRQAKSTLKQILNGTKPSERHKIYTCGRVSERDQLKHRAGFGPIGDEKLGDEIMALLLEFHNELTGNKDLSYVADVWLPEAIIWSIQKIDHVDRERAEKMFLKGSSYAVSAAEVKELNTKFKQRKLSSEETKERIEKAERAIARL